MKPYLSRLIIACWFMGMVAFAVWGVPAQGQEPQQKYLPLALRHVPLAGNPALRHYLGMLEYGDKDNAEIYTVRADGSELTRLTDNEFYDTEPHVSPDGRMIAFLHGTQPYRYFYGGAPYTGMVMNRDGSNLRPLVLDSEDFTYGFKWSPVRNDVVALLAATPNPGLNTLAVVSPALGITTVIASNVMLEFGRSAAWGWSPDGQYIYYGQFGADNTREL